MPDGAGSALLHAAAGGGRAVRALQAHHPPGPQAGQHAAQREHGPQAGRLRPRHQGRLRGREKDVS